MNSDDDAAAAGDKKRKPTSQEEWRYAEMEISLREVVVELVTPTVQRAASQGTELENLRATLNEHTKRLNEMSSFKTKVNQTEAILDQFRDDLAKNESKVHQLLTKSQEDLRGFKVELEGLDRNLQSKESAIQAFQRSLDRAATEINWLSTQQSDRQESLDARLDAQSRKAALADSELEVKLVGLEAKHLALTDELWGEETGLAKASGELRKTKSILEAQEEAIKEIQKSMVDPQLLVRLRVDVTNWLQDATGQMATLKRDVGSVVNSTREELQTAIDVSATRSAGLVDEVRRSYGEELKRVHALRDDVESACVEMRTTLKATDRQAEDASARTEGLLSEQREVIDHTDRMRKRDRTAFENEIKGIKKRLGGVFDSSDVVSKGLEHVCDILGLLLESVSMQCALDTQDTLDREHVFLLGLKEETSNMQAAEKASPHPLSSPNRLAKKASPHRGKAPRIISVDQRCLSCSGQAPAVLSAFKMACLQYNPSPVHFGETEHSRFDILRRVEEATGRAAALYFSGLRGRGRFKDAGHSEPSLVPPAALGEYAAVAGSISAATCDKTQHLPKLSRSVPATPRSKAEASLVLH